MPQLNYVNHCWSSDQNDLLRHKSCVNPHSNSLCCHPLTVAGHAEFLQKVSTTITSLCMHIMLQSVNHVTKTINLLRKHNSCIHISHAGKHTIYQQIAILIVHAFKTFP